MKPGNLSILGIALATALAATACNRADETASTYSNEPAATSQPAQTTTPASTAAGTNTAATDTTSATGTAPATAAPTATAPIATAPITTADATTPFDDMDINNDGSLSQDELTDTHPLRQAFTVVDSDGNGTLSRSEVDSYRSKMAPPGG